jgi:PAS domain S-box-containing protein
LLDAALGVIQCNAAWLSLFGPSAEGRSLLAMAQPEARAALSEVLERALGGEDVRGAEASLSRDDGEERVLRFSVARAGDGLLLLGEDVTDLATEAREFRALAEGTSDYVSIAWVDGTIFYINPAGLAMCGREGQDPRSLRIRDFRSPSTYQQLREEIFPSVIAHGHWKGETVFRHADGSEIPVSQVIYRLDRAKGPPRLIGTIVRDLRDQRRMEALEAEVRVLSTPIIRVGRRVLLLPLLGQVDAARATRMTASLLDAIVATQSRVAILDLTGITEMEQGTLMHVLGMVAAARLLGSECVLSGIAGPVAAAMTRLEVDLTALRTFPDVERALGHALRVAKG